VITCVDKYLLEQMDTRITIAGWYRISARGAIRSISIV